MFSYTPFGWVLLIGSLLAITGIIRSAIVPSASAALPLYEKAPLESPPDNPDHLRGALARVLFALLFFGIAKYSWFGILPGLASFFGTPVDFADQFWMAMVIGLLIGSIAYLAVHLAEAIR